MKSVSKIFSLFVVLTMVFVSGCVGGGKAEASTVDANSGLVMKNLKTSPTFHGEDLIISFDVENVGGRPAENACVQLYGHSWVKKGEQTTAWYTLGANDDNCATGGRLNHPNGGVAGDRELVDFTFDTDDAHNPIEESKNYDINARIYWKSQTRTLAQINALAKEEYLTRSREGTLTATPIEYTSTPGPIQVRLVGDNPIRMQGSTGHFEMVIEKVGGDNTRVFYNKDASWNGKGVYEDLKLEHYNKVKLFSISGASNAKCGRYQAGTANDVITLTGDSTTLRCSFTIADQQALLDTNIEMEIILEYGYMAEYKIPVTIQRSYEDTTEDTAASVSSISETNSLELPTGNSIKPILKVVPFISNLV